MTNYNQTSTLKIGYTANEQRAFAAGKLAYAFRVPRRNNPCKLESLRAAWFAGYDLAVAAARTVKNE